MLLFPFCFGLETLFFGASLVQKIKIISLSWNLVPRFIQICRIQWWCLLFLFYTENTLLGKQSAISSPRQNRSWDSEIGSCCQHGFFIFLWRVCPWNVFVRCLKIFLNNSKCTIFILHESVFCLKIWAKKVEFFV